MPICIYPVRWVPFLQNKPRNLHPFKMDLDFRIVLEINHVVAGLHETDLDHCSNSRGKECHFSQQNYGIISFQGRDSFTVVR